MLLLLSACSYPYFLFVTPQCHRMVTVRELARSQGFPDSFVFYSINDNVVTVRAARVPFHFLFRGMTEFGFPFLLPQSDAPTNWKRSSLARCRGYRTRAARSTFKEMA